MCLDEVILVYLMKTNAKIHWESNRAAYYLSQNYKSFLKNAVWLVFFIWALTLVMFLLVLGPAALLVGLFPDSAGGSGQANRRHFKNLNE